MADIELYSAKNPAYELTLKASTDAANKRVNAIAIETRNGAGVSVRAEFQLSSPVDVPTDLIEGTKLKSWSDIQRAIVAAQTAEARQTLERARDKLRKDLAELSVDLSAAAGGFLGINGVGMVSAAATARLSIDLTLLDPTLSPPPADDAPVLSATLSAAGHIQLAGKTCDAAMRIGVTVTWRGLISALPSLSLGPLPDINCPFDLHWPAFDWPQLTWKNLSLPGIDTLFRLDLPALNLGLRVVWDTKPLAVQCDVAGGKLTIHTTQPGTGSLLCNTKSDPQPTAVAAIENFAIELDQNGALALAGMITGKGVTKGIALAHKTINQPELLPFQIDIDDSTLTFTFTGSITLPATVANAAIIATLELPSVIFRAKSDPSLLLALHIVFEQKYDVVHGQSDGALKTLEIVEPYPVKLIGAIVREAADAGEALLKLVSAIPVPQPNMPDTGMTAVLKRIAAMLGAAVAWLAQKAGSAIDALLGAAQAVVEVLKRVVDAIVSIFDDAKPPAIPKLHLVVELRLDAHTFALRQLVVSPAWDANPAIPWTFSGAGLDVTVPLDLRPSLIVDLDAPASIALVATEAPAAKAEFKLATDLWFKRDTSLDAVRASDQATGENMRLIEVSATLNPHICLVLLRHCAGNISVFEQMDAQVQPLPGAPALPVPVTTIIAPVKFKPIEWGKEITVTVNIAPNAKDALLPFLQSSQGKSDGHSLIDSLNQYVTVEESKGTEDGLDSNGIYTIKIKATLHLKGISSQGTLIDVPIGVQVDIPRLEVRLENIDNVVIDGSSASSDFNLLGLTGQILPKSLAQGQEPPATYPFFEVDFSSGDMRLALASDARIDLTYGKVASSGRGIVFRVDEFGMSRNGIDLSAKVDPDNPVQLAGVDMPFRFREGGLLIRNGQIQSFSIRGSGQLPPELIGEADANIAIMMGRGSDGSLIVLSADAELDMSGNPIVCHATSFTFTLSAIGLRFEDYSQEGSGYHFYFTLTGSARFTPKIGGFTEGLLKNFESLTITLDQTPLARDPSMLLKSISFQVTVEPKKRINFFNLFTFELRGIGFHPKSPAFNDDPAMSISGQVSFLEAGDIVSPRFDFHELWIARAPAGDWRPRVKFDGLTVGVRFGGAASIEGTAIAVDDTLPTLFAPGALPRDVTARGFLAAGKLSIKGWGQMSASMGFLELRKSNGAPRQAFFIYGEVDKQSIEIPTPLGAIYLREVGFGFGFRYTLAAFNRADQVKSVKELIDVLDGISKYQGELATVKAWEPEAEGDRMTLALRGLITIATASGESEYNDDGEKDLPNPVLFDIVAALRSDLTFFMNARVWIARNYADWVNSSATSDAWRTNPTLRGYLYLSVPRSEFLGRLIADGSGDVDGQHPQLPPQLVAAMKGIRWSATIYIRPGLFHQEFGWPYELQFTIRDQDNDTFRVDCKGGIVNRIEDLSVLYGIAFSASGYARIGGSVGGRSFGASVTASATFSLDAKFIAYISLKRFGDTLFYGSLACDVAISLAVHVWLEFGAGPFEVHLEVGFSMSLTLSVAMEVAISPGQVGGRACASVAVGAFGRSLRLGVGFGFNEGMLVSARSRVERFLSLGLTVALPDAQQGVAPAAAEQPRGPASRNADESVEQSLDKRDQLTETPAAPKAQEQDQDQEQAQEPKPQGRAVPDTGYWAMLFPVSADDATPNSEDRFVMVLVPRDHSETGISEAALPRRDGDGKWFGTFYAPPAKVDDNQTKSCLSINLPASVVVTLLDPDGTLPTVRTGQDFPLDYQLGHIAIESDQKQITLGQLLSRCFIIVDDQNGQHLAEPIAREVKVDAQRLPAAREDAAQMLTDAAHDLLHLQAEARAANEVEERRASIVAALCESAAKLAAGGSKAWAKPVADATLDVRTLGVAFVVKGSDIPTLFTYSGTNFDRPPAAKFVITRIGQGGPQLVHLFNPPETMFRKCSPRLATPVLEPTPDGIRLDWDLEPAFGPSTGVWNNPEFDLKHYRIERIVMSDDATPMPFPALQTTTKAAAPIRLIQDPASGELVWRFTRANAQFVDDLADLPDDVRKGILGIPSDTKSTVNVASINYVIVPVDTAGTGGASVPLVLNIDEADAPLHSVRRAALHVEYHGNNAQLRSPLADPATPDISLGMDDGNDTPPSDPAAPRPTLKINRTYTLRVRHERGVPSGVYGADAVTEALARPSAADFGIRQADDRDFTLTLLARGAGGATEIPSFDDPIDVTGGTGFIVMEAGKAGDGRDAFYKAIGVIAPKDKDESRETIGPIGVRFAIRPEAPKGSTALAAAWCPADITILFAAPDNGTGKRQAPPIAAPVEIFEHPLAIDAAPLMFDDLYGEAGRVVIKHPDGRGVLSELLGSDPKHPGLCYLPDAARRVATRLRWNAWPVCDDEQAREHAARRLAPFFGGFDLFELDAASEAEGAATHPLILWLTCTFDATINSSIAPGDGTVRLNAPDPMQVTELYLNPKGAIDESAFDALDQSVDRVKGHLRLVNSNDASRWMEMNVTAVVRASDYRTFEVECIGASGPSPFSAKQQVDIVFTRLPGRHLARVQALPDALAALDPAEIADFARVEAHYPSETARIDTAGPPRRGGAPRKAGWFSPAESFAVWPERPLRRALSINVDETVVTALLGNGRPTHIRAMLDIDGTSFVVDRHDDPGQAKVNKIAPASADQKLRYETVFPLDSSRGTVSALRALLQALTWDAPARDQIGTTRDKLRRSHVLLASLKEGSAEPIATADIEIDLDPDLHPVLADTIDRVRYASLPARDFPWLRLDNGNQWSDGPGGALDGPLTNTLFTNCTGTCFSATGLPATAPQPEIVLIQGDGASNACIDFSNMPKDDDAKLALVMQTLTRLCTRLSASDRKKLGTQRVNNPADFAAVQLQLVRTTANGPKNPPLTCKLDIDSIICDMDRERAGAVYRRYEPMLEPLPKTAAADVSAWMDETPPQRDPHGWGVLRTLGLAIGLRLYNTETFEYVKPLDGLKLLKKAFEDTLGWYADVAVGAPFVDVLSRAGGTMKPTSFDGGTPVAGLGDTEDFIKNDALALMQIALRPLPSPWSGLIDDSAPVAYYAITKGQTEMPLSFNLEALDLASGAVAVADVLDLTSPLARAPLTTLAFTPDADSDKQKTALADLTAKLTDHVSAPWEFSIIDVSNAPEGALVALVRMTVSIGDANRVGEQWQSRLWKDVHPIGVPGGASALEPFGRFSDMSAERFGALAGTHASIASAIASFRDYTARRWPNGWPDDATALIAKLPDWTRRFLEHGANERPPAQKSKPAPVYFSLAEVTRPDPWRVAVDPDGAMEVLFTHDDRKRRLKRYAVKPFGRYDSFVAGLRSVQPGAAPQPPALYGAWTDALAQKSVTPADFETTWNRRLCDIVLPRSEPVAPPVLVDARRIEVVEPKKTVAAAPAAGAAAGAPSAAVVAVTSAPAPTDPPRRALEFIYKRHPEEILSEANVTVEGALSFEAISVGFWREFPMQRWAIDLCKDSKTAIDTAEAFGGWNLAPPPSPTSLIVGDDSFGGLSGEGGRYPDGWQGALVLRTESTPFFFRTHAAAFASAGVVVSEPVIATVEEGHYELNPPWKFAGHPTPPPIWSVERRTGDNPAANGVYITFSLPLVRFVDEMTAESRSIWLPDSRHLPEVFSLPDPLASYEIRAVAKDASGVSSASPELSLMGLQRKAGLQPGDANLSGFWLDIAGQLFGPDRVSAGDPVRHHVDPVWWHVDVQAKLRTPDIPLAPEKFDPAIQPFNGASPLPLFELPDTPFTGPQSPWPDFAPQTSATISVTPPSVASGQPLQKFKDDLSVWRGIFAPYASNAAAKSIIEFIDAWIAYPGPSVSVSIANFTAGLPHLADALTRPAALSIQLQPMGNWRKPPREGIRQRENIAALLLSKFALGYDQASFSSGMLAPVRRAMRSLCAQRNDAGAGNRFVGIAPMAWSVPASVAADARQLALAAHNGNPVLPSCADVIIAIIIEADPKKNANAQALLGDLIEQTEKARFTATAITDLGGLEDGGAQALVHFPASALAPGDLFNALQALGAGDPDKWTASGFLLRMPPNDDECRAIGEAIDKSVSTMDKAAMLKQQFDDGMSSQLFGERRTPGVKIFRGTADTVEADFVRKNGS